MRPRPNLAIVFLAGSLLSGACDDRSYLFESTTTTRIDGDVITTTLRVDAITAMGGHGDSEVDPNTGLDLRAGFESGELLQLAEVEPGEYVATLDGAAPAYHYQIEGDDYIHDGPQMFTAAATVTSSAPRTALVTWDPPVPNELFHDDVFIGVTTPSGRVGLLECGKGFEARAELGDRFELLECALPESGTYRITIRRQADGIPPGNDSGYLYAWAELSIERELTLDVP